MLPAGGARAAYQVGVMGYLAETFPDLDPRVYTGISAGSINACFLSQGKPFKEAAPELCELWSRLDFDQVLKTNFNTLFRMFARWTRDLFIARVTKQVLLKSLLDATPLTSTLLKNVHFWRISRAIREGQLDGLAISATNYHDGTTTVFFDSTEPLEPWSRERRKAVRVGIRVRHIMASCSIPILFEPVRLGDHLYGDGSLRFSFPFSPPIHLGATHLFAIGTRCPRPKDVIPGRTEQVGLGFVAGAVLNSIFLDSVEADYENLQRMNAIGGGSHYYPAFLLRPSVDLGSLATKHFNSVPFHLRQLLGATARSSQLGDLLSYLMFSPPYVKELLDLGRKDAAEKKDEIRKFLDEKAG